MNASAANALRTGANSRNEANRERDAEASRCHEPGEHSEAAHRVQRAEEDEKILSDAAQRLERRQEHDRQADDQSPHQLVVESEIAQRPQRRAESRARQAMVRRPGERECGERLQARAAPERRSPRGPPSPPDCFSVSAGSFGELRNLRDEIAATLSGCAWITALSDRSSSRALRRANSSATVFDACEHRHRSKQHS